MEEENNNEEEKEQGTPENTGEGLQSSTGNFIDRASEAAKRLETENKTMTENLSRWEKLKAMDMLGGQSESGVVQQPKPKMTDEEYAEKVLKGEVNPLKDDAYIN